MGACLSESAHARTGVGGGGLGVGLGVVLEFLCWRFCCRGGDKSSESRAKLV